MTDQIKIPHGFKQVSGQIRQGDGVWDGLRFRKVRREYPRTGDDRVFIRACEVEQTELVVEPRARRYLDDE